ncbi:erythromycin esterase family protein [Kribbella deserti]|uniref:Erythromycin esterase family protein n=1 Tax=Kribbella deserti TaxID=1926257 RepID=A0ABV6QMI9_9ACTN
MKTPAAVQEWLKSEAIPLPPLDGAGAWPGEVVRWLPALNGVRVVGLGEATHGTREFFQLKHHLLAMLVREGFTTFAMEASTSAAPAVDAYIRDGVGTAAEVVSGLGFWTWRTEEIVAMVEWMRAYNRDRPDAEKLRFAGIDPQRCAPSVRYVTDFLLSARWLDEAQRSEAARYASAIAPLADVQPGTLPDRELFTVTEELTRFLSSQALDQVDLTVVHKHVRILRENADVASRPPQAEDATRTAFAARDRYMADAVTELLDADLAAKVVLWAHNGHLTPNANGMPAMGSHLRERLGQAYYVLGLVFGGGTFRAKRSAPWPLPHRWFVGRNLGVVSIPPATMNLEHILAKANPHDHLVNLRAAKLPAEVRDWLQASQWMRSYGAVVPRVGSTFYFTATVLADDFDGLAYIAHSTPSRAIAESGPTVDEQR